MIALCVGWIVFSLFICLPIVCILIARSDVIEETYSGYYYNREK